MPFYSDYFAMERAIINKYLTEKVKQTLEENIDRIIRASYQKDDNHAGKAADQNIRIKTLKVSYKVQPIDNNPPGIVDNKEPTKSIFDLDKLDLRIEFEEESYEKVREFCDKHMPTLFIYKYFGVTTSDQPGGMAVIPIMAVGNQDVGKFLAHFEIDISSYADLVQKAGINMQAVLDNARKEADIPSIATPPAKLAPMKKSEMILVKSESVLDFGSATNFSKVALTKAALDDDEEDDEEEEQDENLVTVHTKVDKPLATSTIKPEAQAASTNLHPINNEKTVSPSKQISDKQTAATHHSKFQAALPDNELRPKKQLSNADLTEIKQLAVASLNKYISFWKFSWFGHHHDGRARIVRTAIGKAQDADAVLKILNNQRSLFWKKSSRTIENAPAGLGRFGIELKNKPADRYKSGYLNAIKQAVESIKPKM